MTRKRIYNYTVEPSPVGPIDTIDYTYRSSGWKDQLASYDGNTITYDDSGNPLKYGNYGFNWSGRQLDGIMNVSSSVSFIASYKYNDQRLRTKKTLIGNVTTSYTWDGTKLVGQTHGTTTLLFSYDQNDNAISVKYNGTTYYYQRNGQGDIIGLYNASGTRVVAYTYDTWGKLLSTTGSLASTLGAKNPLRYRGYYYDTESGFYYLQSRYYDPNTCRFLSADDTAFTGATGTIVGHNLYAYCENNPVMNFDPSGCFSIPSWTISVAIDAIILTISSWLNATWMGLMAPLKAMGKKAAASYFAKNLARSVSGIATKLTEVGTKALIWIGKTAFAAAYNIAAKAAIAAIIMQPMRIVTACMSVGGMIAGIWDYLSDKKFDGCSGGIVGAASGDATSEEVPETKIVNCTNEGSIIGLFDDEIGSLGIGGYMWRKYVSDKKLHQSWKCNCISICRRYIRHGSGHD